MTPVSLPVPLRLVLLAVLLGAIGTAARPLRAQPARPDTLRVLTLNLWHDQRDWPARLEWLVEQAAALRPDVVMMQEVLQDVHLENQATTIARRLGLPYVHFVSTDSANRARRYGNAIASRFPFEATAERRLRPHDQYRTAAFALVRVGGRPVRLYSTHLHHMADAEGSGIRAMQTVDLLDFVATTVQPGAPFVLGGDFNAEPDSPEMRLMSPFRDVAAVRYASGPTFGVAYGIALPGRRIDYLFDDPDAGLSVDAAHVVLNRPNAAGVWASDHFGVAARFVLR